MQAHTYIHAHMSIHTEFFNSYLPPSKLSPLFSQSHQIKPRIIPLEPCPWISREVPVSRRHRARIQTKTSRWIWKDGKKCKIFTVQWTGNENLLLCVLVSLEITTYLSYWCLISVKHCLYYFLLSYSTQSTYHSYNLTTSSQQTSSYYPIATIFSMDSLHYYWSLMTMQ